MRDFIYDQSTGRCVAFIENGEVFADAPGSPKIGTVRAGNIYALGGTEPIGHLSGAHVTGLRSDTMPVAFANLLAEQGR